MDFSLTQDQRILLDSLEKFGRRELEPLADEYDRNKKLRDPAVVRDLLRKVRPFGAISGPVPEAYGGLGLDYVTTALVFEKLVGYFGSLAGICLIQTVCARLMAEIEKEEIKKKVLPGICAGDSIACLCVTEPNVGSFAAAVETTVKKVEGGFSVNGTKTWISNGSISDKAIVIATTDRSLGPKGLVAVLVDRNRSPYPTRELEKMGMKSFPTSELIFQDVRIPEESLLTDPGKGLKTTLRTFELARSLMGVCSVGLSRAALALAVRYAQERKQFGREIGTFQLIQAMIADMRTRTEAAALLTYRAFWKMDQGERCDAESAMAKYYATEAAVETASECVQILGAYGLSEEYPAERYFRDARMLTIPDGTTQIQKLIVARDTLGLSAFV
jgi:alkylation response protein AidB-like acyl-CoA dehydrogenase